MIELKLKGLEGRRPCYLFIGAHCDDIEIGCGGTALELFRSRPDAHVHWVVLSSDQQRAREARKAASLFLKNVRDAEVVVKEFRGSYFPTEMSALKDYFEELKAAVRPDVVFAHYRDDLHQDHRTVGELVWNTFRDNLILEYEIPKYDGGLGSPSVFVPLSAAAVKRKVDVLMKVFKTQHARSWFTPETFRALMRLRGIECNAPSGYAEAFYARKLVIGA